MHLSPPIVLEFMDFLRESRLALTLWVDDRSVFRASIANTGSKAAPTDRCIRDDVGQSRAGVDHAIENLASLCHFRYLAIDVGTDASREIRCPAFQNDRSRL